MEQPQVIDLSASEVRALDVAALRARGPAAIRALVSGGESEEAAAVAVPANLERFIEYMQAHPAIGAVRLHAGSATVEVMQ